jgi:hypothetical protein
MKTAVVVYACFYIYSPHPTVTFIKDAKKKCYWPKQTFPDAVCFHLSGTEAPHHDQNIGVWCAIPTTWIVGLTAINTEQYNSDILQSFFRELQKKKMHGYFMQDAAMYVKHTATYLISLLSKIFKDKMISHRLWPARSLDLNPCDSHLWENLKKE